VARWVIVMAALMSVVGCDLRAENTPPFDRASVKTAFAEAGEPLVVGLDMAVADPGSSVDVIFVPAKEDIPEPPFELTLFDSERAAEKHAQFIEEVAGIRAEVHRLKNAILRISPSMTDERRARLAATLESLGSD
jgi:hypothetical protein